MKARKALLSLFGLFLVFWVTSCKEETETTFDSSAVKTGQSLQQIIKEKEITEIIPYEWKWDVIQKKDGWVTAIGTVQSGSIPDLWITTGIETRDYEIKDGFIRADEMYFNLDDLKKYEVKNQALVLYFYFK